MTDPTLERDERAQVAIEADALESAIDHIRNGKAVLDNFPESRKHVSIPEKAAETLEKRLKPLNEQLAQWGQEDLVRRRARA